MDEQPASRLIPVTPDELEQAVSHALRFDGRKQFKLSGEIMGNITASHLVHCLTQAGFVVMRKPLPALPTRCAYAESAVRAMEESRRASSGGGQEES